MSQMTGAPPGAPAGVPASEPEGTGVREALARAREVATSNATAARVGRQVALAVAFLVVVQLVYHLSLAYLIDGIALGSLYGIIGVGLVLIYRTTRVINFAAAAIGAVPAIVALILDIQFHVNYVETLPIALVGGPLMGGLVDIVVMRRFSRAPRLIVTVVTIGVAQSMAALGFFIPVWMGQKASEISAVPTPWQNIAIHNARGQPVITGNQVAAFVTVVVLTALLALFLKGTKLGIAMRAAAENSDRAALLGIPVKRVITAAWMIAGLLGAMAIFVQAPLIGVPSDATLGFDTLLYALAAAVVARMDRIGLTLGAGMGVGVLVFASVATTGSSDIASAAMLLVILGALLFHRAGRARALDTGVETWRTVKEFRSVPAELRSLPEVIGFRLALVGLVAGGAVLLGLFLPTPDMPDLVQLPIFALVAVSLVVLTGWAGLTSLGQFALAGAAAAVAGGLAANHNIDFFFAIALGIAAGVVSAVIIGLPAVRVQGLYLAVTTLAFAYAMTYYVMNPNYFIGAHIMPSGYTAHLARPVLWQRVSLHSDRTFYFVCLVFLALAILAAASFRRYRSGRVLIAVRDNQRAASAYSLSVVRTRLAAFAVGGGIAGLAGVLLAYSEHNVISGSFSPEYSIFAFLAAVVGGLGSLAGAVLGTVVLEGATLFLPQASSVLGQTLTSAAPLLLTGPLLILMLVQYPSGMAEVGFKIRDAFLRRVASRRGLLVPSLVADRRVATTGEEAAERDAISLAKERFIGTAPGAAPGVVSPGGPTGSAGAGGSGGSLIACPVCSELLTLQEAASHPHLSAAGGTGR